MYSLDQVIYFLEQRQQTEDWNIRDVAIAYLKGYREVLPEYAQMKLDAVKNEPLTWNELKQMEGKPVWIEFLNDEGEWNGEWCLVESSNNVLCEILRCQKTWWGLRKITLGKTWQAYRKERV